MKFGEKVRDLRKKHSLTQDELAQCLGINKRTIIGWERDGRYPRSIEMLEKMADIFHVPLTYLQPDQSLFIERAAEAYGKKGKIEAQHLAFELTELFASGELTPQDMDGIMYEMHKAYFKYREQKREKERISQKNKQALGSYQKYVLYFVFPLHSSYPYISSIIARSLSGNGSAHPVRSEAE